MRIAKLIEDRLAPLAVAGIVLLGILQIVSLLWPNQVLRQTTQSAFIPVLLVWAQAPKVRGEANEVPPLQRLGMAVALGLCWAADILPTGMASDQQFLTRAICFFGANVTWILTLWPHRERSCFTTTRVLMLPYVAIGAIVMSACLPGAESLAGLLPFYVAVVIFMAILSTGLGWPGTLGGLSSLVAHGMLGMSMFVLAFDPGDVVRALIVMPSYMLGEALLVYGVRRASDAAAVEEAPESKASADVSDLSTLEAGITRRLPPLPGPEVIGNSRVRR